jgi:hypothetical protein
MVRNERCHPRVLHPQPVHLKDCKALRLPTPERRPRRARIDLADTGHGALAIDDVCSEGSSWGQQEMYVSQRFGGMLGKGCPQKPTFYPQKTWFTSENLITCNYVKMLNTDQTLGPFYICFTFTNVTTCQQEVNFCNSRPDTSIPQLHKLWWEPSDLAAANHVEERTLP